MLGGSWGKRKIKRAGHCGPFPSSHGPPRAFYFFDNGYFYRDTQREPLPRGEGGGRLRESDCRSCIACNFEVKIYLNPC